MNQATGTGSLFTGYKLYHLNTKCSFVITAFFIHQIYSLLFSSAAKTLITQTTFKTNTKITDYVEKSNKSNND